VRYAPGFFGDLEIAAPSAAPNVCSGMHSRPRSQVALGNAIAGAVALPGEGVFFGRMAAHPPRRHTRRAKQSCAPQRVPKCN